MPAAGVPASVAVPSPLLVKVTPAGNVPCTDSTGAGKPLVVTVKLSARPIVNKAPEGLIAGGWPTVSSNSCVASGETPLAAVIVRR